MPVTLRNGKTVSAQSDTMNESTSSRISPSHPPRPSPYLLLIYPILLAIGSTYSAISPTASSSSYTPNLDPGIVSSVNTPVPNQTINYFAGKRNVLNVYFVKLGWFWTTLAFVLLQLATRPSTSQQNRSKKNHYIQSAFRYVLVTISWILVTQWFFGPGLIDRSFTVTGGHCEAITSTLDDIQNAKSIDNLPTAHLSAVACKAAGGHWRGGYDISGHVFILVLSSAFLLYELHLADRHSSHPSISPRAAASIAHDTTEEEKKAVGGWENETVATTRVYIRYFLYAVVVLDFWMLMMTAIWFHTWIEKLSGLLLAGATLWGVYFLGDLVPAWRDVIGGL